MLGIRNSNSQGLAFSEANFKLERKREVAITAAKVKCMGSSFISEMGESEKASCILRVGEAFW